MTIWCKHVHRKELQKFFLIFGLRIHQLEARYSDEIPDF